VNHPEMLLLPALMLADYFLTIAGARAKRGTYERYFGTRHYELNPVWQKAVARLAWFNPRHLVLTAALTAILVVLAEGPLAADKPIVEMLEGLFFAMFGIVVGRHLGNLATFAYLRRHPDAIEGRVTMSHDIVLWISTFQTLALIVPAALLAAIAREPMSLGFFAGTVVLFAVHLGWIRRHRSERRTADAGTATGAAPESSTASATERP
jgi:hypothetical protein